MIKIHNNKVDISISLQDYTYVFLCILFLGSATIFSDGSLESFGFSKGAGYESLIGKLFMLLYGLCLLYKHNIQIKKCFDKLIIGIIVIFMICQYVKYGFFSPFSIVRLFNLYFSSVLILVYKKDLIYIFEDVIYKLAYLDFLLWVLLLICPSLVEWILSLSPIEGSGLVEGNSLIVFAKGFQYEIFIRNIGFAWEPGRFGTIISFGIFLNLIINNFNVKNNNRFIILLLALLSSQSTTAYMAFIFVVLIYLFNINRKYFLLMLPFCLVVFTLLMNLDFMADKMQKLSIFNDEHIEEFESSLSYYETVDFMVPQRFDAMVLEFMNILNDPLIGNASDTYGYLYELFGVKFSLSNGILRIFANMGIAIGILYYYMLYKSSKWMSLEYNYKGWWAFMIFFMIINVSYSWIFEPVFLSIVFYPYIINKHSIQ